MYFLISDALKLQGRSKGIIGTSLPMPSILEIFNRRNSSGILGNIGSQKPSMVADTPADNTGLLGRRDSVNDIDNHCMPKGTSVDGFANSSGRKSSFQGVLSWFTTPQTNVNGNTIHEYQQANVSRDCAVNTSESCSNAEASAVYKKLKINRRDLNFVSPISF